GTGGCCGGAGTQLGSGNSGSAAFNNAGIFNKTGSANLDAINVPFTNTNTVNINNAQTSLQSGGTDTGTYNIGASGTLNFASGTRSLSSGSVTVDGALGIVGATVTIGAGVSYTQSGSLSISNGSLTMNGDSTIAGNLTISGGTLSLPSNMDMNGSFNWSGGTLGGTGGTFNTANGVTSTLNGGSITLENSIIWNNDGTVNWSGNGGIYDYFDFK
ncbi:MAG: hypothetical protein GY732_22760, partial [Gammaproteobacteria bacterium]|nr:hypothetical protein [Gammaproteobacteria bacterium]